MSLVYRSTHPFPIVAARVEKSPFTSMANVRRILDAYKQGQSIGFTYQSSLKSMGLIPRSNGHYELGMKYRSV